MPITPFLKWQAFDPELVEAMGAALASTCHKLGLTDRTDTITALVAEKIIELAQRGLRSPTEMHSMAMNELRSIRIEPAFGDMSTNGPSCESADTRVGNKAIL